MSEIGKKKINNKDELISWMRLIRSNNVGPRTFWDLMSVFSSSASTVLENIPQIARKGRAAKMPLASKEMIEKEIEETYRFGADIIMGLDERYPKMLSMIPDRPPILIVKGNDNLLAEDQIAIIGSRDASSNALSFTTTVTSEICKNGYIITSGLARGIDAAAHRTALDKCGNTIAVIAGGIDDIYPKENQKIYQDICNQGLLISEAPIGSAPLSKHFPKRNRIIAGMSKAIVVIEAKEHSGTIITANMAIDYKRPVFAVPGSPLDQRYRGTNKLIKQGALLMQSSEDVLNYLKQKKDMIELREDNITSPYMMQTKMNKIPDDKLLEKYRDKIIEKLSYSPTDIEKISEQLKIPVQIVNWVVVELELSGKVERIYGNKVSLLQINT